MWIWFLAIMPCVFVPIEVNADAWVGLHGGAAFHMDNDSGNIPKSQPQSGKVNNARLPMFGVSVGARTAPAIIGVGVEAFYLTTPTVATADGVAEFTSDVKESIFGFDFLFYIAHYVHVGFNPLPFWTWDRVSGSKIRVLPGRTTDLGRTWDGVIPLIVGVDFPLGKLISLGAELRYMYIIPSLAGPDSSGISSRTMYWSGNVKVWF